jgi:hypothetical protein
LILLFITSCIYAQQLQPLRVDVEFSQSLWLEVEYAIPIASTTLAPVLSFGELSANSIEIGLAARVYPFSSNGDGFYATVGGLYTYDSAEILDNTLDSEKLGVGFRLILFKVLTGNLELGLSLQNNGSNQPFPVFGQVGIGVAL